MKRTSNPVPRRHWQFSLRSLMAATVVVALACGAVSWCLQSSAREREAARLRATRESFLSVWGGLALYDRRYGHLPYPVRYATSGPAVEIGMPNGDGRPLCSWRAEVAALAGSRGHAPWDISQPWDSPANRPMTDLAAWYGYDGMATQTWSPRYVVSRGTSQRTNMLAITGPGTAFGSDGQTPRRLDDLDPDTILLVEVRDSGIHWMEPGDFDIRTMPHGIDAAEGRRPSSRHRGGFHVLFADGQVWQIAGHVPFAALKKFFTAAGAAKHDRQRELAPHVVDRYPSLSSTLADESRWYHTEALAIDDPQVTDAELSRFAGMTDLLTLDLSGTRVTGSGLGRLGGLAKLWKLSLDTAPVTGPGLEQLERLPRLTALHLADTPIADRGLKHLGKLVGLETLHLDGTAVTDAGLEHLEGLTNLRQLGLSRTRVAGPGLVHLARMAQLSDLHLGGTEVDDDALQHLEGLKSLQSLSLQRTRVTSRGVDKLRAALPECTIRDCPRPEDSP